MLHIVQLREDDTIAPRLDFENHLQIIGAMWDQPTLELYQRVHCPITLVIAEMEPTGERAKQIKQLRKESLASHPAARPTFGLCVCPIPFTISLTAPQRTGC